MRSLLATTAALALLHAGGGGVRWHAARLSDSIARKHAITETWAIRAVAPDGRRSVVVRFWTKDNPSYVEWVWYRRGHRVGSLAVLVHSVAHSGPGVTLSSGCGPGTSFIRYTRSRWILHACGISSYGQRLRADLVLRNLHPGVTLGPARASHGAAWLSLAATGLVDGIVVAPGDTMRIRGWYGAAEHDWTTYSSYSWKSYLRRDLALIWLNPEDIRLVWGVEPYHGPNEINQPKDALWRGVSARLGSQRSACDPGVHRVLRNPHSLHDYAFPTWTLRASCGGSTITFRHSENRLGGTTWDYATTYSGRATSSVGGVGFMESTVPRVPPFG